MKESLAQKEKILSKEEVLNFWRMASGDTHKYDNPQKSRYFSKELLNNGTSVKLEFHPDYLNGKHRLVIEDFSSFDGDTDYLDGLQMAAGVAQKMQDFGINFTLEGPKDYSDGKKIKKDIEALIIPTEETKAA